MVYKIKLVSQTNAIVLSIILVTLFLGGIFLSIPLGLHNKGLIYLPVLGTAFIAYFLWQKFVICRTEWIIAPGTFYKRHLDRFQNNDSRKFSMIMYLNTGWIAEDGGELCIRHEAGFQNISPLNGKVVFFKSNELEYEVLMTHKNRISITGWLKG